MEFSIKLVGCHVRKSILIKFCRGCPPQYHNLLSIRLTFLVTNIFIKEVDLISKNIHTLRLLSLNCFIQVGKTIDSK